MAGGTWRIYSENAGSSSPPKQPFDVGKPQLDVSGAAMVALADVRRRLHLAQERVHLLGLEPAAGAHRAVAGQGGGDVQEASFERQRLVPFRHVLGEIAHQRARIDLAEQRRRLAHRDRARAKRLDDEAVTRKLVRPREQAGDIGLVELDDFRDQEQLPRHAILFDRGFQPFIDDALMRGVLIDDDDSVAGLRDDIGFVQLRARRRAAGRAPRLRLPPEQDAHRP